MFFALHNIDRKGDVNMYRLVIIDDDSLMLRHFVTGYDWNKMGFTICASFTSAQEGLQYLKESTADAVITDIKMPNMTGLELAKICLDLYPDMPFILLSAFSSFEYAKQAIAYNVVDYVLKPINDEDLKNALAKLKSYLEKTKNPKATGLSENQISEKTNINLSKIKQYIADNLHNNITVNDVAKFAMINPKYFSYYFKKHTGMDFSNYIKNARMEKACELLIHSDLKVSAIAEQVGYRITSPFFKYFSEKYGMTPTEYRNKYKNN